MARNDGVDRTVVRNSKYKRGSINIRERHNERKNESYSNQDIVQSESYRNVVFKQPEESYLADFDRLCAEGVISTRGQKQDAYIIDEMVFDVNSAYFERRGGYAFAKKFFEQTYQMAVQEVGGDEYILSAVMHADERNQMLSETLQKDVFHYHLHVVYVPVVQKEVRWSKRCKDKALIGTLKEVVTQVSHSKKWASEKYKDAEGKTKLLSSYSKLQDRFFEYMKQCGYDDIERGERGSSAEHLSTEQFKRQREQERLKVLEGAVQQQAETLEETQAEVEQVVQLLESEKEMLNTVQQRTVKIAAVEEISVKPTLLDATKVVVAKEDFEDVKTLAQQQIIGKKKDERFIAEYQSLRQENQALQSENRVLRREVRSQQITIGSLETIQQQLDYTIQRLGAEKGKLESKLAKIKLFIERFELEEKFDKFMKPIRDRSR